MSERLTDEELAWLERNVDMVRSVPLARRAVAELKARRAADLTAQDREALEYARGVVTEQRYFIARSSNDPELGDPDLDACDAALSILSRLINTKE